jgi:DNA modification methylase
MEFNLHGVDLFGDPIKPKMGIIAERFVFPPFSILDTRQGEWQERRRQWLSLGIKSELGRGGNLLGYSDTIKRKTNTKLGKTFGSGLNKKINDDWDAQTSIFDATLCELIVRWFSCKNSQILDPFSGGSVRGIVCGALGRKYYGIDLRKEQIEANYEQHKEIIPEASIEWHCGDSRDLLTFAPEADLVFSCPPYGDLEVYSDDPKDLSTMLHNDFLIAYEEIISLAVSKLKNNRFACFVVGDYRDKKGYMCNFVSKTIHAFEKVGATLYNEAILVNSVGSAAMRVTTQFNNSRKIAKTHQNVLVFCKGDPKKATQFCGEINEKNCFC